jgi:hypothetical protein
MDEVMLEILKGQKNKGKKKKKKLFLLKLIGR